MSEQIKKYWEERHRREQQELCPPAAALFNAIYAELRDILQNGGTDAAKAAALVALDELAEPFWPQVKGAHFPSLWSRHCCVANVYDMCKQELSTLPLPLPPPPPLVTLGYVVPTMQPVQLPAPERMRGMYVIGMNGTGKSTLLLEMLTQDIQAGNGLCLLDPHGDLTNAILDRIPPEREDDLIVLDLTSDTEAWGLNLFHCPDPTSARAVTRTVDQVLQAFGKVWGDMQNTPGLADMLRMITVTLVSNPGTTMGDIQRLLTDDAYRAGLVANVQDATVRGFWELEYDMLAAGGKQQMRASLLRRIRALLIPLLSNIVTQKTNSVDFRAAMDAGNILLIQLDAELEDLTAILGTVIVGQLLQAALSRKDVERTDRRPFYLYADEYHRFATPFFGTLIQEARKYQIATVMAHQSRYQLKVLGEEISKTPLSVPTLVVFQVSAEDARELAARFTQPVTTVELSHAEWQRRIIADMVDMPLYTAYCKTAHGQFRIKPRHNNPVAVDNRKRDRLRAASRQRYY